MSNPVLDRACDRYLSSSQVYLPTRDQGRRWNGGPAFLERRSAVREVVGLMRDPTTLGVSRRLIIRMRPGRKRRELMSAKYDYRDYTFLVDRGGALHTLPRH